MNAPNPDSFQMIYRCYIEWRRLKGYPPPAKAPIDAMIDDATGVAIDNESVIDEFLEWLRDEIFPRFGDTATVQPDQEGE